MKIEDFFNQEKIIRKTKISCTCGLDHKFKEINIEKRTTLDQLAEILVQILRKNQDKNESVIHPLFIYDKNTWNVVGKRLWEIFSSKWKGVQSRYNLHNSFSLLIPTKDLYIKLKNIIQKYSGLSITHLIPIGSGSITDLTRYCAFTQDLEFVSIPTATSMDGYASSVAPLIVDGKKTTFAAKPPDNILIYPPVLKSPPKRLKSAGFGDLLGKKTCALDWYLSNAVYGENVCEYSLSILHSVLKRAIDEFIRLKSYTNKFLELLLDGLIISGLAISMVGTSRPASGAEHHISHTLEQQSLDGKIPHFFHGETVSLGTFIIAHFYQRLFSCPYNKFQKTYNKFRERKRDTDTILERKERLQRVFGSIKNQIYPSFTKNWKKSVKYRKDPNPILDSLQNNWPFLQEKFNQFLPSLQDMQKLFKIAEIPSSPSYFHLSKERLEDTIICAKEIRDRYTILSLLDDLGLLENYTKQIVENLYRNKN